MGVSRQRQEEKRKRRMRQDQHRRSHPRQGHEPGDWSSTVSADALVAEAAQRLASGHIDARFLAEGLVHVPGADDALRRAIARTRARLLADGWTEQVARHATRRLGAAHPRVLLDGQPADLLTGLQLLAWALTTPPLPQVAQPIADAADAKLLDRVRALLSKAEATEFAGEAEAFTAKAQELISRHSLERALAAGSDRDRPGAVHVLLDDPYADAKSVLLSVIADANRARAVYSARHGFCTVFGFATDVRATEMLFASLLVQAVRAMTTAGERQREQRQPSFRRSFLLSFAARIGERLDTASGEVVAATGDARALPVLAARHAAVDEAVERAYPMLRSSSVTVSNRWGWAAGRAAADQADLAAFDEVQAS